MCGRYGVYADDSHVRERFGLAELPVEYVPRYNVAPTQPVLVVGIDAEGHRAARIMRWGFVPSWAASKEEAWHRAIINARAETVAGKPMFLRAMERHRVIVPASGFYEWVRLPGGRQPYLIRRADRDLMGFAAVWGTWRESERAEAVRTVAIITVPANELVAPIHDRMPAILASPDAEAQWLDPATLVATARTLLVPCPSAELVAEPVSSGVNNVRNDDPSILQQFAATA